MRNPVNMGYEMMRTRTNSAAGDFPAGQYTFGGTNLPNVSNTGQSFANFLLGTEVAPLVRICAGGGQRWPSLPRHGESGGKDRL
jgi:hypothetical protein